MPWMIPTAIVAAPIIAGAADKYLFGGEKGDEAVNKQADFIVRMMGREGEIYPEVRDKLEKAGLLSEQALDAIRSGTGPAYENAQKSFRDAYALAQPAFDASVGEINKRYGGIQDSIGGAGSGATRSIDDAAAGARPDIAAAGQRAENFELAPEALAALDNIRNTRLKNIETDASTALGSTVADLARRGVVSSSTAEGGVGRVADAMAPAINATEADYWSSRLNLPSQMYALAKDRGLTDFGLAKDAGLTNFGITKDTGMTQYGLAKDQGAINAGAYGSLADSMYNFGKGTYGLAAGQSGLIANAMEQNRANLVNPWLDMWRTSAGIGSTTPGTASPNTAGAELAGTIGSAGINAWANSPGKKTTPPPSQPWDPVNSSSGSSGGSAFT